MESKLVWGVLVGGALLLVLGFLVLARLPLGLNGTKWRLVSVQIVHGPVLWVPDERDHPFTLAFQMNRLGGKGACNSYGAQYQVNRFTHSLWVGGIFQTKMACIPVINMERERMYLGALSMAKRYELKGNELRIYADMDQVLVFKRNAE